MKKDIKTEMPKIRKRKVKIKIKKPMLFTREIDMDKGGQFSVIAQPGSIIFLVDVWIEDGNPWFAIKLKSGTVIETGFVWPVRLETFSDLEDALSSFCLGVFQNVGQKIVIIREGGSKEFIINDTFLWKPSEKEPACGVRITSLTGLVGRMRKGDLSKIIEEVLKKRGLPYYFDLDGGFVDRTRGDFGCMALNKKSATKKFKKWNLGDEGGVFHGKNNTHDIVVFAKSRTKALAKLKSENLYIGLTDFGVSAYQTKDWERVKFAEVDLDLI